MAASERLREACALYERLKREEREREGAFTKFWRSTIEDWTLLSADLARRWKLPGHRGDVEDLRQEMAIGVWRALRSYEGGHGVSLPEYVVWNALAFSKKKLHKLRGAKLSGNSGKNPSRIERPFSSMGDESSGDERREGAVEAAMLYAGIYTEAEDGRAIEVEERREDVLEICRTGAEEVVVEVTFAELGLDEGARRLYEDPDVRLSYRLGCEGDARRVLRRAAEDLAGRVEEELVA